jgi:hypothetical protein
MNFATRRKWLRYCLTQNKATRCCPGHAEDNNMEKDTRTLDEVAQAFGVVTADTFVVESWTGTDKEIQELQAWLDGLNLTAGRTPVGMKKIIGQLQYIQKQLNYFTKPKPLGAVVSNWGAIQDNARKTIANTMDRFSKDDLDLINRKLSKKEAEPDELKLAHATYINRSNLNFQKFKERANEVDKFLGTLRGFHAKPLSKPLKVIMVKKSEIKAKAKYKRDEDAILFRPDAMVPGDGYASSVYVLLHELGHRYERYFSVPSYFNYKGNFTTPYSRTDSMAGNEEFAELFALSHWPNKYPQYADQIQKFIKAM